MHYERSGENPLPSSSARDRGASLARRASEYCRISSIRGSPHDTQIWHYSTLRLTTDRRPSGEAGVWLPVPVMPGPLGDIVALTPLGAGALALGKAASGGWPDLKDLVVMAVWMSVLGTAATRFFRWE